MKYLIMLEAVRTGFAVQVPDLAISTFGNDIESAKTAASEAIKINIEAYQETGQELPETKSIAEHLKNPDFDGLLFTYVDIDYFTERKAA